MVATPGRIIDLIEKEEITVADLEIVIVDEADRMADIWVSCRKLNGYYEE